MSFSVGWSEIILEITNVIENYNFAFILGVNILVALMTFFLFEPKNTLGDINAYWCKSGLMKKKIFERKIVSKESTGEVSAPDKLE